MSRYVSITCVRLLSKPVCTHAQVVTRFLMAGSPVLPWLAAIMTTRASKEPVPLTEDDNMEVLMKIECRSNLRSNTDTILFQVRNRGSYDNYWNHKC